MRLKIAYQKGAALVEFALILIPLLLLVFGIIEFGLILYNKQVITNASREGARFGIESRKPRWTQGEIDTEVNKYCATHLVGFPESAVTIQPITPCAKFGDYITVDVGYTYNFLVLPNFISMDPIDLRAQTTMRCE
jgi:Flp pilus assembly protein TadG